MSDTENSAEETKSKSIKILILFSFIASAALGGGAYWAVSHFGPIARESEHNAAITAPHASTTPAFVPIDPMIISIDSGQNTHHLRFKAQLDVPDGSQKHVATLMPRVVDVLNTFLRALSLDDIQHPSALTEIRSQMLRRVKIVLGDQSVNDILVMEFVLN